jgi:hypothetical protein
MFELNIELSRGTLPEQREPDISGRGQRRGKDTEAKNARNYEPFDVVQWLGDRRRHRCIKKLNSNPEMPSLSCSNCLQ